MNKPKPEDTTADKVVYPIVTVTVDDKGRKKTRIEQEDGTIVEHN